jgi:N-acetylneuraminic acid mutarotase
MASGWSISVRAARGASVGVIFMLLTSVLPVQGRSGPAQSPPAPNAQSLHPIVRQISKVATTKPLRTMHAAAKPFALKKGDVARQVDNLSVAKGKHGGTGKNTGTAKVQNKVVPHAAMPAIDSDFEGIDAADSLCGCLPPDTEGDVGPNNYVQWVNVAFQIYAKDGTPLLAQPLPGNIFWQGVNSACANTNNGDPIVQYDQLADRWFFSQFAFPNFPNGPFTQCVALSQTGDPTGAYYLYQYDVPSGKLNDYPKFGVWPDAYYQTINQYTAGSLQFAGAGVFALERDKMLQGLTAQVLYVDLFGVEPWFGGMLPADLEGLFPPASGTPGLFAEVDDSALSPVPQDQMEIWQFHVDWNNPSNSTFGLNGTGEPNLNLPVAAFDANMCNFNRSCIPQPGTSQGLDAISDRLMYRLSAHVNGNQIDLVTNHTVDVDGTDHAGVRWYDVRTTTGADNFSIFDQGTYAPDSDNRWMGSAAMDASGDIAVGYSVSSSTVSPSIRVAGRLSTDPAGQLSQGETTIITGSGAQLHPAARWGDYSALTLDPTDGCTYWYTQEYTAGVSTADWHTRIAHFKFPSCTLGPTGTLQGTVTSSATNDPIVNALVSANAITTHTDGSGHYSIKVPVNTYDVTASAYGFAPKTVNNVSVTDGGTTVEDFALDPLPTVAVSGTVTDGSGHGWPLYAKITIDGYPGGPVFTNPVTGQYSVTLVQNTPFTFHVNAVAAGYVAATRPVEVPPDSSTQNFALLVNPDTCVAPGYHFNEGSPVLSEGFGGSDQIPPTWTVVDNVGEGHVWQINDPEGQPNLTGGSGNFADINSDFYGPSDSQDTELITPVIDLSSVPSPIMKFNNDYFGYPGQTGDVDVTTDGGANWTNLWHHTSDSVRGPDLEVVSLAGAGGQAAVQVRFHFAANFGFWWMVDNVSVLNRTCDPIPGGMVVGNVTDLTTSNPLNGAKVTSNDQPSDNALSAATPADPNNPDGYYSLFSTLTGSHPFTASKANYTDDNKTVNVVADGVVRQDFALGAGHLTINPTSLEVTVPLGGTKDLTPGLTISNDGTGAANFELSERDRGSTILFARGARAFQQNGTFSPYRAKPGSGGGGGGEEPPLPPNAPPWTNVADYPTPIMDNTADAFDGKIYSVGGFNGSGIINNGYVYDPGSNSWSPIASMADAREKPAAAFAGGKLYVVGGWDQTGTPDPKLEIYDPSTDSWTTGASIPAAFAAAVAVNVGDKIYVIGGCGPATCGANNVYVYDPGADSWSSAANYPEQTSWTHCGAIGGLIYCGGGTFGNSESQHAYVYDPGSDSWSPIANLPQTRWAGGYVAANGMLIISGGVTNNFSTITNEGFAYDPGSDTWTAIANSNFLLYRGASACGFYKLGGSTGGFSPVQDDEALPGLDVCGVPPDVKWLSEDPSSGTVDVNQSVPINVHFDASVAEVPQPGDYMADIAVKANTPYSIPAIPVTMHVTPPASWGKLQGTVVGLGQCDVPGNPLAKASVHVHGTLSDFDLKTDNNGFYQWWMDSGNSPLSITVHQAGWVDQTHSGVLLTAGGTTTENFTLRLAASCLHVTPVPITKTQLLGTTTTATLHFTNTGALDAQVKLGERKGSFTILKLEGAPLHLINGVKGQFTPAMLGGTKGTSGVPINAGAPLAPTWGTIASYPSGIMDNGADIIDGKVYSVGGVDSSFNTTAHGYVYDPNTDAWTPIADMPVPREKPGVAAVDGKLYVSGGWDLGGNPIAETDVYNPATNTWSTVSSNPHPAAAPGVAVDGSSIYFVGGCQDGFCTTSTNNVRYDTASDTWTTLAGYPHNNAWEACGGINGSVYCAGGTDGNATFTDGFAYNPGSDAWSPIASMPLDLWASAAGAPNGLLVLSSGVTNGFNTVTNQGVAYDPATDSWSAIPNAQFAVYRAGGSCGFYKIGGSSAGFSPMADSERLSELDSCGVADVPWLSEAPATFTVPANTGSANVVVTLAATAANGVDQPGTYTAQIVVGHNTVDSIAPISVTLNVTPPRTWAKVAGTVLGRDCQGNTAPLRGVQIHLSGHFGYSFDLSTDGAGKYARWLDTKYALLTVTASKDGYVTQFKTKVSLKKGKTTTVNFTLQKLGC